MMPGAGKKPVLLCAGYLGGFGELGRSKKEDSDYCWLPFDIKGLGGSRDTKGKLFFTPEFFEAGITPKILVSRYGKKMADSRIFAYKKNIASKDNLGILQALCGTVENFGKLNDFIDANLFSVTSTPDEEQIASTLVEFFNDLGPQGFGYIQKQRKSWDGVSYRMDANGDYVLTKAGKQIKEWTREPYYDIDSYFSLTKSRLKTLVSMVEKNNAKLVDPDFLAQYPDADMDEMKFTFDLSDYDVEPPAQPESAEQEQEVVA
jgi:hypothetical protein